MEQLEGVRLAEEVRVAEAVLAQRQSLERLSAIPHLHPRLKELQQQVGLACNVYPLAIKFSGIEFASALSLYAPRGLGSCTANAAHGLDQLTLLLL